MDPRVTSLPTLESERLVLRELRPTDADALFTIFSNPEVMRFWSRPPMESVEEAVTMVQEIHDLAEGGSLFEWVVERRSDGRVIGTNTLASISLDHRRAEVGFALARDAWGQGYARESVTRLLDHAFDTMDLARIEADVDPANAASLGLLDALGFVREGYMPERFRVGGGVQDTVWLGLLRSRWRAAESGEGVRVMTAADRPVVRSLLARQLAEHELSTDEDAIVRTLDGLMARPDRGFVLVADLGAGPIGVAYVAYTWTLEHGGLVAWLEELYVAPEHRGGGIGGRLLDEAIARARLGGALAMDLEIDALHDRAANLYTRSGFTPLSRRRMQLRLV